MIALFMAGGSGTRLWPLSRENNPKQLHQLVSDKSLMKQTVERISPLVDPKNIWIVTNKDYQERISEHSEGVPKNQIIAEPFPIGTNLAVGLGAIHIARQHPDALIVVGWADAYIGREAAFHRALEKAQSAAQNADGVILAVPTTYPAVCYGYIEIGEAIGELEGVYKIARFEEKPKIDRAQQFFESNRHFWNSGISIFKVSKLLELMQTHAPEHYLALQFVAEAIGTAEESARMELAFKNLEKTSIDKAIFEKSSNLAVVAADLDWNDIGSWSAVYDVQSKGSGNVTRGEVISVDTEKCLIYAEHRLVATLGVSDLVIVETEDAILITHKDHSERLKELHDEVKKREGRKYL